MTERVKYELIMELQGLPKTTNRMNGRGKWAMKKHRDEWKNLVALIVPAHKRPRTPLQRARLVLTRYSSESPDYDGLVSSFKAVIDGLREIGVIADDRMINIGIPKYQHVVAPRGQGKIRVEVYEEEVSDA